MNLMRRRRMPGNSYPNIAAQFVAASNQGFSLADNASLSTGDIDFSGCAWVNSNSFGADRTFACKSAVNLTEWVCRYNSATSRYRFLSSTDGITATAFVDGNNFGAPGTGVWHFLAWTHDSVANQISLSVNAGTADTAACATGPTDRAGSFAIGERPGISAAWDGLIDCVGFWKKVLTTAEITLLYKGGVGMAYRDLTGSLLTSLNGYWNLDGNGLDASGNGNHLTNDNGATFGPGKR